MRVLLISVFALAALLISSCSGSEQNVEDLVAKGGKKYGGEFKFMSSEKIKNKLGFIASHSIEEAASDLKKAFEEGLLPDSFTDNKYFNIKVMNSIELK